MYGYYSDMPYYEDPRDFEASLDESEDRYFADIEKEFEEDFEEDTD